MFFISLELHFYLWRNGTEIIGLTSPQMQTGIPSKFQILFLCTFQINKNLKNLTDLVIPTAFTNPTKHVTLLRFTNVGSSLSVYPWHCPCLFQKYIKQLEMYNFHINPFLHPVIKTKLMVPICISSVMEQSSRGC